jgi:serine/threonine-protein kinase SRPK3
MHRGDIQTRHYRAPEVILRLNLDEKIDIWSIGCVIFELSTGIVLFAPNKKYGITCDLQHLWNIQQICGKFPEYFNTSRKFNVFFKESNVLRNSSEINKKYIETNRKIIDSKLEKDIYSIVRQLLQTDPKQRSSLNLILKLLTVH